ETGPVTLHVAVRQPNEEVVADVADLARRLAGLQIRVEVLEAESRRSASIGEELVGLVGDSARAGVELLVVLREALREVVDDRLLRVEALNELARRQQARAVIASDGGGLEEAVLVTDRILLTNLERLVGDLIHRGSADHRVLHGEAHVGATET